MKNIDEAVLFLICGTIVLVTAICSVTYYQVQQSTFMSKNIENGIAKGIDPVAVRCAYASSTDNVCITYAATKAHENHQVRK